MEEIYDLGGKKIFLRKGSRSISYLERKKLVELQEKRGWKWEGYQAGQLLFSKQIIDDGLNSVGIIS